MPKTSKKVELETTLVIAVTLALHVKDVSVGLFLCTHKRDLNVRNAIMEAFTDWSETPKGQRFIETNGTNWGDSLYIPDVFLVNQFITKYESLQGVGELRGAKFDREIIVDHDERLVKRRGLD